ncbi:MAG TPA: MlaD family protein [Candidatus Acidoferrum sp.]|nr:MlaD family protein [Candidatus Acidoferrum sp.]HTW23178.1 MlaD family protein [Candidatus Baltobacteraceae bacterium]
MAQRKQLTWTELRVGVFVLAALFLLMVAIFYVTGAGFFGPRYRLITYLPEVEGMKAGAPVDLDGVEVGNVQSIGLTPHPVDREHSITLVLRLSRKYQNDIRTDSKASLVTQGLLGDRYVTISRGLSGSVIPTNGVIEAEQSPDIKQVVQRGADVAENLNVLSDQLNDIVSKVRKGQGTIGKVLNDPSLYNHLDDIASRADAMVASVQEGKGTVGKLVASDELYNKVDSTVSKVDDTMSAIHDQKGTVGKLIYDPSAYNNINGLAQKGNALLDDVHAGKGTLGKLVTDDTLYANLRDASANVRDATGKLNSNQGSIGKFFNDPAFYDNMTGLSGDLRLMIADFRRDPKKYLHIKLGIF